jgi:hypothetical protein
VTKVEITCEYCGKLALVSPYKRKRFCSTICGVHGTRGPGTKRTCRKLTDLESVPNRPPDGRYPSTHGYMRLMWKTGLASYVWCYEHRLVAGLPTTAHVHHKDGNKANNQSANLEVLSQSDHARLHALAKRNWNVEIAAYLHSQGWQYKTIAFCAGVNPTTVLRGIRKYRESHYGLGQGENLPTMPERG